MSSQSGPVHTPNNNTEPPTNQFSASKSDLTLYGSPIQIRTNRNVARRSSSFVKMATEDHFQEPTQRARLTRSDARRGSSFIRAMSEDIQDDNKYLGLSLKPNVRRGSSFLTVDDGNEENSKSVKDVRRGSSFLMAVDDSNLENYSNNTPMDIRRGSSFIKTVDDSLEDILSTGRPPRLDMRRGSSFIRMISADINNEEMHSTGRLSSKPESRRGSGVVKMMSEENSEDNMSRRSSKADVRRGSSFSRMISEENDVEDGLPSGKSTERSEISEKLRKSLDNTYRHSLESISEYKSQTFSSASLYPSVEYSSLSIESPPSELSSEFALRSANETSKEMADRTYINSSMSYLSWIASVSSTGENAGNTSVETDNRSGEWNSFWSTYNSTRNDYFSSPYLCPSNSGEDLSFDSNGSTQRGFTDKTLSDTVFLTAEEVNEAIDCTQRLMDILRGAIKRSEPEMTPKIDSEAQHLLLKEDKKANNEETENQKEKTLLKSTNNSCIDVILNHTGMVDILKRVINKRREVMVPTDERSSLSKFSTSEGSIHKK